MIGATPSWFLKQLAHTLKHVRGTWGLTQRELARGAGLGQSRLALIEAVRVDFRTSTLVQLARALDLELVLAPRRVLPAVQGNQARGTVIVRPSIRSTLSVSSFVRTFLTRSSASGARIPMPCLQKGLAKKSNPFPVSPGAHSGEIRYFSRFRSARALILARATVAQAQPLLDKAAAQQKERRQMGPAAADLAQAPPAQRAAYSLEDEIS